MGVFIEQEQIKEAKRCSEKDVPLIEFARRTVIEGINQGRLAQGIEKSEQCLSKKEHVRNEGIPEIYY